MKRFLRWLFQAYYSPYAKCVKCGRARLKIDMHQMYLVGGRFCSKEEADAYRTEMQW